MEYQLDFISSIFRKISSIFKTQYPLINCNCIFLQSQEMLHLNMLQKILHILVVGTLLRKHATITIIHHPES